MKKNLLGPLALIVAVAIVTFSSFSESKYSIAGDDAPSKYITYDGSGPQNDLSNYNSLATAPTAPPAPCSDAEVLCWFRVDDRDHDNDIDAADFAATFAALNTVEVFEENTLNEEEEIPGILQKKADPQLR